MTYLRKHPRQLAATLLLASVLPHSLAAVPDGWFEWPMVEPATGSALDVAEFAPAPLGQPDRISTRDGHFVTADGRPVRFFGVNFVAGNAFPSAADAELIARRLAKAGINVVRLHHLDNIWEVGSGNSLWPADCPARLEFDAAQLDRLHHLIATLARHGIYSNLNLKTAKVLGPADGLPESAADFPDFQKRIDLFNPRMIALQKDYARRLLTTVNPYTGHAPVDDPAVAMVEINNENSVLGYYTRDVGQGVDQFAEPFRSELLARWNAWLAGRYADTAALVGAWREDGAPQPVLDTGTAQWWPTLEYGAEATFVPGADASSFTFDVTKAHGPEWAVLASAFGLKLEENRIYSVVFEARATEKGRIGIGVVNDLSANPDEPWRSLGFMGLREVGPQWREIRIVFPAHSVGLSSAALGISAGSKPNHVEIRHLRFIAGVEGNDLGGHPSLEARTIPAPTEPSSREWADWITFLSEVDQSFADEMRAYLRDVLGVRAPLICSQMNFSAINAVSRERSMEFADTHVYWEHPEFPGTGWDPVNWFINNSPQVAVFRPEHFGELGSLAFVRIARKPYVVSEYDHAAPSEFVCEMYPELAVLACRQDWDGIYPFDLGTYGSQNPDGHISGFFDQINHPAKWSLAPFVARAFRGRLVPPAGAVAELHPADPVWKETLHVDSLWRKTAAGQPLGFLDCRLQVDDRSFGTATATITRSGTADAPPARVVQAPQGQVLVASAEQTAVATGFLGGTTTEAGPLTITCPRFGRDFATVAAVSLDGQPLGTARRTLVTIVARAENTGMQWNEAHNSVGTNWGHGPTLAERVPATITLAASGPRRVYTLKPDGTRSHEGETSYADGKVTFSVSADDATLHYEFVAE